MTAKKYHSWQVSTFTIQQINRINIEDGNGTGLAIIDTSGFVEVTHSMFKNNDIKLKAVVVCLVDVGCMWISPIVHLVLLIRLSVKFLRWRVSKLIFAPARKRPFPF